MKYFAFTVSCFKARQCVNKCMGIMLQSSSKVHLAVWNKHLISSFDLGMSWQADLSGYILPSFLETHLSCSPAVLVRMLCGTRHSEHLIILQGSQIQITKPINKYFHLQDLYCSLALFIRRLAWRAEFGRVIRHLPHFHECKWHFSTGLHAVPQLRGQVILRTRA